MSKKLRRNLIIIGSIVIVFVIVLINAIKPRLNIEKDYLEINVFDEYTPVSYSASLLNKDLTDKVKIDGIVDTNLIGEYNITYELKEGSYDIKKVLKVRVKDNVAPDLKLIGEAEYNVCSVANYVEPGYTSLDNYDGDVTSSVVKRYVDENTIEYSSSDKSGNISKLTRKLIETDSEGPKITLNGNETTYVVIGSNYSDPGATANDNCDGLLTNNITVEGSVDTKTPGEYKITYKVKDTKGNETTKERKVEVVESLKNDVSDNKPANSSGVIYLTFDDGPGSFTDKILDTLSSNGVKATFFVTLAGSDDTIKREYNEGHTVALHTATHNYKYVYASVDQYFEDLNAVSDRVKNLTGYESKYIRFPGGSSNTISRSVKKGIMTTLAKEVQDRGYKYYDWNVDVDDAGGCTGAKDKPNCVLNNFKKGLHPNRSNVVLMHDIKSYTAEALNEMIKYGKENGYEFKPIDENTPTCHHGINN